MAGKQNPSIIAKAAAKGESKPVQTVRFQEGISEHLEAKKTGDRSRFYFKDGSEYWTYIRSAIATTYT